MERPPWPKTPADDRRREPRRPTSKSAKIRSGPHTMAVEILDISSGGAKTSCPSGILSLGDRVSLIFEGQCAGGQIAWTGIGTAGIRFDRPPTPGPLNDLLSG